MPRRLALVDRQAPDTGAEVLAHARAIVLAAVPELAELLAGARPDAQLVDVAAVVPASRRVVLRACREGRIEGARRVGRRWLATRASVEAWLRGLGPRALPAPESAEDEDDLEETLASLARPSRRRGE